MSNLEKFCNTQCNMILCGSCSFIPLTCTSTPTYLPVACQHEGTFEICRTDTVSFEFYQFCTPGFLHRCTSCCFEPFFWKTPASVEEVEGFTLRRQFFCPAVYNVTITFCWAVHLKNQKLENYCRISFLGCRWSQCNKKDTIERQLYLTAFTGEQTVVVPRDFVSTDWTQLLQTHITSVLHSGEQA